MSKGNTVEGRSDETLTETDHQRPSEPRPDAVAPHLFVSLDCDCPEAGVARHSLANVDRVVVGRGPERSFHRSFEGSARTLTVHVPDARVSTRHMRLVRVGGTFLAEDTDSRNGTRIHGSRIDGPYELADGDVVQVGHTLLRYRAALTVPWGEGADLDRAGNSADDFLATMDPCLARRALALPRVAASAVPVLLLGETGTGKEVLARAIHRGSNRRGPFVAVNCGALPPMLVESQLFGHVRGAFSGATTDAIGWLRTADAGTMLLDEIGELPLVAQAALLRALQEREVVPVGAAKPVKVDLRVVAATHRPLDQLVARGLFRSDLYARIAGFSFSRPPARERRVDVGRLIAAFATATPVRLTPEAGRALLQYDWPLNWRELFRVLEVAAAIARPHAIDLCHLPAAIAARTARRSTLPPPPTSDDPLRDQLLTALARHDGNVSRVARDFGKARTQVHRWMRRFAIDAHAFRRDS